MSDKEENIMVEILQKIQAEYQANIDRFSQDLIITQLELLLIYAERFYERQFHTRKKRHLNFWIGLSKFSINILH
jgi:hypothetical protein